MTVRIASFRVYQTLQLIDELFTFPQFRLLYKSNNPDVHESGAFPGSKVESED
jgi:hypothetical protein